MATKYWIGNSTAVAQVASGTIDSVDATPANNTFTVTIGGVAISAVGDTDVATTATNLRASLNASTHPYFSTITWSGAAGTITGTADTAGVPFTAALTETGAGTGSVTDFSDTTASTGPCHWDDADNWNGGTAPVAADNLVIENSSGNICYGLNDTTDYGDVKIKKSFTGKIGLDITVFSTAADGTSPDTTKPEYREDYLVIGADRIEIGEAPSIGSPAGSSRIKIDNDKAGASNLIVLDTSTSADGTLPAMRYKAANASADVFVRKGLVGIAVDDPTATTTVGDVVCSASSTQTKMQIGEGVTLTNFTQDGGSNLLKAAATITKVEVNGGVLVTEGDYTVTTLEQNAGTTTANHIKTAGTEITTCNLKGGTLDMTGSNEARTIGTLNPDGGTLKMDDAIVTVSTWNEPSGLKTISIS